MDFPEFDSISWDSAYRTETEHSDFLKEAHKTEWLEEKLDTCLQKTKDDRSWDSTSESNDDELWRVCIDSKMTNVQRLYWSAVYVIGFALPLGAVLISYSGLFRFIRNMGFLAYRLNC